MKKLVHYASRWKLSVSVCFPWFREWETGWFSNWRNDMKIPCGVGKIQKRERWKCFCTWKCFSFSQLIFQFSYFVLSISMVFLWIEMLGNAGGGWCGKTTWISGLEICEFVGWFNTERETEKETLLYTQIQFDTLDITTEYFRRLHSNLCLVLTLCRFSTGKFILIFHSSYCRIFPLNVFVL